MCIFFLCRITQSIMDHCRPQLSRVRLWLLLLSYKLLMVTPNFTSTLNMLLSQVNFSISWLTPLSLYIQELKKREKLKTSWVCQLLCENSACEIFIHSLFTEVIIDIELPAALGNSIYIHKIRGSSSFNYCI